MRDRRAQERQGLEGARVLCYVCLRLMLCLFGIFEDARARSGPFAMELAIIAELSKTALKTSALTFECGIGPIGI